MKRLDALHWSLLSVIVGLLTYLVLTPYEYHKLGALLVRVHRITGDAERLTGTGWKEMKAQKGFVLDPKPGRWVLKDEQTHEPP